MQVLQASCIKYVSLPDHHTTVAALIVFSVLAASHYMIYDPCMLLLLQDLWSRDIADNALPSFPATPSSSMIDGLSPGAP